MKTGYQFKVSSERPEKRGIDLAIPDWVVKRVIHYTTAAPNSYFQKNTEYKQTDIRTCNSEELQKEVSP